MATVKVEDAQSSSSLLPSQSSSPAVAGATSPSPSTLEVLALKSRVSYLLSALSASHRRYCRLESPEASRLKKQRNEVMSNLLKRERDNDSLREQLRLSSAKEAKARKKMSSLRKARDEDALTISDLKSKLSESEARNHRDLHNMNESARSLENMNLDLKEEVLRLEDAKDRLSRELSIARDEHERKMGTMQGHLDLMKNEYIKVLSKAALTPSPSDRDGGPPETQDHSRGANAVLAPARDALQGATFEDYSDDFRADVFNPRQRGSVKRGGDDAAVSGRRPKQRCAPAEGKENGKPRATILSHYVKGKGGVSRAPIGWSGTAWPNVADKKSKRSRTTVIQQHKADERLALSSAKPVSDRVQDGTISRFLTAPVQDDIFRRAATGRKQKADAADHSLGMYVKRGGLGARLLNGRR